MLSRVAESLFWVGRLAERAGHVAQILDIHLNLLLDRGQTDDETQAVFWQQFLSLCADPDDYAKTEYPLAANQVSEYVIAATQPGGILASLNAARESARGVRESISSEVWEQLNTQYWQVRASTAERIWESNSHAFLQEIKAGVGQLYGLVDETMLHDEGWGFLRFGRFFERALNTARILDVKFGLYGVSTDESGENNHPADPIEWAAILRCCWAFEAYRKHYATAVTPTKVAEFLLLNREFPRSVNHAIQQTLTLIQQLEGPSGQRSHAERWLGNLHGRLEYATIEEILDGGLHPFLTGFRERCFAIEQGFYQHYFQGRAVLGPIISPSGKPMVFAEEHQQQQQQQ